MYIYIGSEAGRQSNAAGYWMLDAGCWMHLALGMGTQVVGVVMLACAGPRDDESKCLHSNGGTRCLPGHLFGGKSSPPCFCFFVFFVFLYFLG